MFPRSSRSNRYREMERAPLSKHALDPYVPSPPLQELPADRKPQPASLLRPRVGGVYLVEPVEELWYVLLRYAYPRVPHADLYSFLFLCHAEEDPSFGSVLDGIGEQVYEDLPQPLMVRDYRLRHAAPYGIGGPDALPLRGDAYLAPHVPDYLPDVGFLEAELERPEVHPREVEYVRHQSCEPSGLLYHYLQVPLPGLPVSFPVLQELRKAVYRGQGGLELVRCHGYELVLLHVHLFKLHHGSFKLLLRLPELLVRLLRVLHHVEDGGPAPFRL